VFNGKLFDIKILSLKSEYFNGLQNFHSEQKSYDLTHRGEEMLYILNYLETDIISEINNSELLNKIVEIYDELLIDDENKLISYIEELNYNHLKICINMFDKIENANNKFKKLLYNIINFSRSTKLTNLLIKIKNSFKLKNNYLNYFNDLQKNNKILCDFIKIKEALNNRNIIRALSLRIDFDNFCFKKYLITDEEWVNFTISKEWLNNLNNIVLDENNFGLIKIVKFLNFNNIRNIIIYNNNKYINLGYTEHDEYKLCELFINNKKINYISIFNCNKKILYFEKKNDEINIFNKQNILKAIEEGNIRFIKDTFENLQINFEKDIDYYYTCIINNQLKILEEFKKYKEIHYNNYLIKNNILNREKTCNIIEKNDINILNNFNSENIKLNNTLCELFLKSDDINIFKWSYTFLKKNK